jgi:hypothetical protein
MANTMRIFSLLIVCLIVTGLVLVGVVWVLPQSFAGKAVASFDD